MNVMVATMERLDNLDMPHTPWPLVQPLPSAEPTPTNMPPAPSRTRFVVMDCAGWLPEKYEYAGIAISNPMTKATPSTHLDFPGSGGNKDERIPLIPAIRPFIKNSRTVAIPMRMPPAKEASGVNSVSNFVFSQICIKPNIYVFSYVIERERF